MTGSHGADDEVDQMLDASPRELPRSRGDAVRALLQTTHPQPAPPPATADPRGEPAADPADPERRVLAVSKGNLGPLPPALAFRLEPVPGADVARLVWEGETSWTAAQLLQGLPGDDGDIRHSAVAETRAWLRQALAAGPRPAAELHHEAAARGIGRNALYGARKAEAITTAKERVPQGRWLWMLTPDGGPDGEDGPAHDSGDV